MIRFARYIRAEDPHHEIPPAVFGSESRPRPVPYIFASDEIQRILRAASELGKRKRPMTPLPNLRRVRHSGRMPDNTVEEKLSTNQRDQWRERIAEQARSGVSIKQFCKERGVSAWSFYAWLSGCARPSRCASPWWITGDRHRHWSGIWN